MTAIFKTPAFRSDYKDIWHYVARDSEYQAGRLLERFDQELLKLAENTLIGRPRPELARDLRSWRMDHYVFFYRISATGLEMIRLLHSSRDLRPDLFC